MLDALTIFFPSAKIFVENDLKAAAIATCGDEKGIVCILGTGSNCCYYDGKKIQQGNAGLGYVLGDEASGAYFGKKILQRFFYWKLSPALMKEFKKQFRVTRESAIDNTYGRPHANRYLASFMPFVIKWKREKDMQELIAEGMNEFFETNISAVEGYEKLP